MDFEYFYSREEERFNFLKAPEVKHYTIFTNFVELENIVYDNSNSDSAFWSCSDNIRC